MFFFNAWNWYLALNGMTTIEFWGRRLDSKDERVLNGLLF
jgi:hypothetical protein